MTTKPISSPVEVVSLLHVCRDIETHCAEIYNFYADRFTDDEELRELWQKTFEEEKNHANQFVMAINLRRDGVVVAMKNYSKATEALEMVKGIYAGILVNPPSKIDALRSALKLEQELSGFHLDVIAIFQDEGMKKMFRAMMMADNQHIQSIETMYQKHLRI